MSLDLGNDGEIRIILLSVLLQTDQTVFLDGAQRTWINFDKPKDSLLAHVVL